MTSSPEASVVKAYYDAFLSSTMLNYRIIDNPRIEEAARLAKRWTKRNSIVLDVGCGIGIVTEKLARHAKDGRVLGIDISEQNIWYAKQTVKLRNVTFHGCDVVHDMETVARLLPKKPDIVILIDVIEHIPEAFRSSLLNSLHKISAPDAILVLTYPSPSYQHWLRAHRPEALQIIDNSIDAATLTRETEALGYQMLSYNLVTIFQKHDYVHAVFTKEILGRNAINQPDRFWKKVGRRWAHAKATALRSYRKWKYVTSIFGDQNEERTRS